MLSAGTSARRVLIRHCATIRPDNGPIRWPLSTIVTIEIYAIASESQMSGVSTNSSAKLIFCERRLLVFALTLSSSSNQRQAAFSDILLLRNSSYIFANNVNVKINFRLDVANLHPISLLKIFYIIFINERVIYYSIKYFRFNKKYCF